MPLLSRVRGKRVVAVQVRLAPRLLGIVEPPCDLTIRRRRNIKSRQLAAFEGHHHPAGYGSISTDPRRISPASPLGMLAGDNEVDCLLCRLAQLGVLRHAVSLAQGDRRQAMA